MTSIERNKLIHQMLKTNDKRLAEAVKKHFELNFIETKNAVLKVFETPPCGSAGLAELPQNALDTFSESL